MFGDFVMGVFKGCVFKMLYIDLEFGEWYVVLVDVDMG